MPIETDEDLDDFFDPDEFAVPAVIHLTGGDRNVTVILNTPTEAVQMFGGEVEANGDYLLGKWSDIGDVPINTVVTVAGRDRKVLAKKQHDSGTGTLHVK